MNRKRELIKRRVKQFEELFNSGHTVSNPGKIVFENLLKDSIEEAYAVGKEDAKRLISNQQ